MHQAGVIGALRQHLCHNVFLADMRLGDVLDRDAYRGCEEYGTLPYAIPQQSLRTAGSRRCESHRR